MGIFQSRQGVRMADEDENATTTDEAQADSEGTTDQSDGTDWQAEVDKWKRESRKHEGRSKAALAAFARVARELGLDPAALAQSDAEATIESAKAEAKAEALREVAGERVEAAFVAACAGRMSDAQRDALIDGINPTRFLTEDGKVNRAKITKHIDAIAPARGKTGVDLGQGQREHSKPAGREAGLAEAQRRFNKGK